MRLRAVTDESIIRITSLIPSRLPNLLHFERQGLLELDGRQVFWKKDVPLAMLNASTAIQYNHQLARLYDPKLTDAEQTTVRLRLCGNNWRAALAVWQQLVTATPELTNSAPARQQLLIFSAATLQQLAQAENPSAPAELIYAITESLLPEDFTNLSLSLALAQAAQAVLKSDADFTPPLPQEIREAFRTQLIKTAPQSWKNAVLLGE